MMGTIAQLGHTYFLTRSISSIEGWWGFTQAFLLSAFISSSLMYYTVIADNEDTKESRRIRLAVNIFMVIEIIINLYYYTRHLVIDPGQVRTFDFFFSTLIAILIPVTIKLYSGLIRAKEWMHDFMEDSKQIEAEVGVESDVDSSEKIAELENRINQFNETIENLINQSAPSTIISEDSLKAIIDGFNQELLVIKTALTNSISKDTFDEKALSRKIEEVFEKSQKLFLMQFENKCKVLSDNIVRSKQPIIEGNNN